MPARSNGVVGRPDLAGARLLAQRVDGGQLGLDFRGGPVELDEEHRGGPLRVPAVHRGLRRLDGQRVHHLDRGGHDPGADDVGNRAAARLQRVVGGEHQVHRLGRRRQLDDDLGGDAERALRAGERAEQVVAADDTGAVAEPGQLAGRRDDLEPEHVVDGEAVLETVGAAGVLRDVPADGADDLRRRVGRVEQPVRPDGLGHREVGHARLDDRPAGDRVDFEDAAHPGHDDQHALGMRHRAAGQAGAAAARHERDPVLRAQRGRHPRPPRRCSAAPPGRAWCGARSARHTRKCAAPGGR